MFICTEPFVKKIHIKDLIILGHTPIKRKSSPMQNNTKLL